MRLSRLYATLTLVCDSHACMRLSRLYATLTLVCDSHTCMRLSRLYAALTLVCGSHACMRLSRLYATLTLVCDSHACMRLSRLYATLTLVCDFYNTAFLGMAQLYVFCADGAHICGVWLHSGFFSRLLSVRLVFELFLPHQLCEFGKMLAACPFLHPYDYVVPFATVLLVF
jgi:hypothetical protein